MMETQQPGPGPESLPDHTFSAISERLMDRAYMQQRIREEIERCHRYKREFAVLVCEAAPAADGIPMRRKVAYGVRAIEHAVRASDVIARVYEDVVAVLLVETGATGLDDALFRIRQKLTVEAGAWRFRGYAFPADEPAIRSLAFLTAA
jgi:hypothetical protein